MPIINVHMLQGRTVAQKRALVAKMTDAVTEALGVRPEQVRILIDEMNPEHFAVAGLTSAARAETAAELVKA